MISSRIYLFTLLLCSCLYGMVLSKLAISGSINHCQLVLLLAFFILAIGTASAAKKPFRHHVPPDLEKGILQEDHRHKLRELGLKHSTEIDQLRRSHELSVLLLRRAHSLTVDELERSRDVLRRNFERVNEDYVNLCVEYDDNDYHGLRRRRAELDAKN